MKRTTITTEQAQLLAYFDHPRDYATTLNAVQMRKDDFDQLVAADLIKWHPLTQTFQSVPNWERITKRETSGLVVVGGLLLVVMAALGFLSWLFSPLD